MFVNCVRIGHMEAIEEIKSKIDVVSFISEYITLTRAGRNFRAVCPFHKEKTPSFVISPEMQIWHCFGACGEGGDVFKFLMKIENLEFPEAVRILADRTGVKIVGRGMPATDRDKFYAINAEAERFYRFVLKDHPLGSLARSYLTKDRGMQDITIDTFGLGFAPGRPDFLQKFLIEKKKYVMDDLVRAGLVVVTERGKIIDRFHDRVIFPLRDARGNVLGFSGRVLPQHESPSVGPPAGRAGKYVNTPETPIYHKRNHLYGLDVTKEEIKDKEEAIIVEGEFDLLSSWQCGVRNVVAIKGSAFTQEQTKLLSRFTRKLVLALDMDEAGLEAAKVGLRAAENEGLSVRIVDLGSFKDPDEAARSDREGFIKKVEDAIDAYDYFIDRAFARNNARTPEGVREISRELAPLISNVGDAIMRAYYAKKISERLGISQEVVVSQINRSNRGGEAGPPRRSLLDEEKAEEPKKTRRQILEEQLISLAISVRPEFLLDSRIDALIFDSVLLRIREYVAKFINTKKNFSPLEFVASLPAELSPRAIAVLLDPLNDTIDDSHKLLELDRITRELEMLVAHERINELTRLIRDKEEKKTPVDREREELARLVGVLSRASH